jgi:uncharacterized membrane protein
MSAELLTLRIVHILGGVAWVGSSIFLTFFLMPALATLGPVGGQVIGALKNQRIFTIIPTIAIFVMLAGVRMMQLQSNGFSSAWFSTRAGETYSIGAAGALLAFLLFMGITHPSIMKVLRLGASMATASDADKPAIGAQMNALRAKAGIASKASTACLIVTVVAMAIGRYI